MKIKLNGKEQEIEINSEPNHPSILHLLKTLELAGKPVVIEHNKTAVFPRDYGSTNIKENDQIEIINIAAGG